MVEPREAPFGESSVGITEFMSEDNVEIKCTVKHRYSDFIVNEIDEQGNVVWFPKGPQDLSAFEKPQEDAANIDASIPEGSLAKLKELLSEEDFTNFTNYLSDL